MGSSQIDDGKKVKGRKSPPGPGHAGMCLSRSRLFLINKRKGRKSLGQGNGKQPSKKSLAQGRNGKQPSNKGGTGPSSQGVPVTITKRIVDMYNSWVLHDHDLCIRSRRKRMHGSYYDRIILPLEPDEPQPTFEDYNTYDRAAEQAICSKWYMHDPGEDYSETEEDLTHPALQIN